jgi:hypothetical protein
MNEPLKRIESGKNIVWMTQPNEINTMLKRRDIAFNVARGKLEENNGKIETIMQTGEAFGRSLFSEYIKEDPNNWTIKEWLDPVVENILNPLGTGAIFTKVTEKEANSLIFRCQLHEDVEDLNMASLFTYGYLKGMFLSAFPKGEILIKSTIAQGAPMIKLTFKTNKKNEE